jgi:release factor glutamine methyltransferase
MFVADNRLASAKAYFNEQLSAQFSASECKQMWQQILYKRFRWTPTELLLKQDERLSESDLLYIRSFVKRLQIHEPFQHILGEVFFSDLVLKSDARALVPRPETEELIDLIQKQSQDFSQIVDVCTGSGCIALALKSKFPQAEVLGLDLSQEAIALATENASITNLEVAFQVIDIFEWHPTQNFDLLVSNPPYIPQAEKAQMQANVVQYEPHMALFVPDQAPLLFYERLQVLANKHLAKGGWLALEIHEDYAVPTKALFETSDFTNLEIYRDLQGKNRMLLAQKA